MARTKAGRSPRALRWSAMLAWGAGVATAAENRTLYADEASLKGRQLEFVHITKTGGSVVELAGARCGISWGSCHFPHATADRMGCPKADLGHLQMKDGLRTPWHYPTRYFETEPYPGAEMFTVVRNPYDRAVSEYYNRWGGYNGEYKDDAITMNWWIRMRMKNEKGPSMLPQALFVFDESGNQVIQHVIHTERLEEEFDALMKKFAIRCRMPGFSFNARDDSAKHTAADLDATTRREIERYYADDFKHFGYEKMRA